jgi:hypothetical protein
MSLLHRGTEVVTVFPEEMVIDSDGNKFTRPSSVGVVSRAVVQVRAISGSQAAGTEKDNVTEERLRLRLVNWQLPELGVQAQVEWEGRRYSVHGEPQRYRGSPRTAHTTYTLLRK